jgi:cytochrome c oxidase subunit 4
MTRAADSFWLPRAGSTLARDVDASFNLVYWVLTAITVAVSYVDLGAWNIAVALLVATAKASLVAAIFMHLWYDHRFNALVLGSSVFFLVVLLAFTFADTGSRGGADAIEAARPRSYSAPFAEGKPDLLGAAPPPASPGNERPGAAPAAPRGPDPALPR